jgi:hypothetical protein
MSQLRAKAKDRRERPAGPALTRRSAAIDVPAPPLALKHRWSVADNYLTGISAGDWWRLLRENDFAVDPAYWHRALFVTLISLVRAIFTRGEDRRYRASLDTVEICRPPLFVLGYWRSGTTHLQNLLSQDSVGFAFANTYQVFNPRIFLTTEEAVTRLCRALMPRGRPADNVARAFDSPEEDEFAACLTSLRSPYLAMNFPRRAEHYQRYLTFDGVPEAEVEEWRAAMLWFVRKLTLKYDRPLVLKSPPHTARIRLLLELFPGARFVHIHRNPYHVFQSQRHRYDTALWYNYLQRPDAADLEHHLLSEYQVVYNAFFEQQSLIPAGHFHEVAYEAVEADPVGQVREIYAQLGLPGFAGVRSRLERYVDEIRGYRKNQHPELSSGLKQKIHAAWGRSFDTWAYPR